MNKIIDTCFAFVRKHGPEILIGIGSVGIVTGTVIACKETKKIDPILEEHSDMMDAIHKAAEDGQVTDMQTGAIVSYDEHDRKKDVTIMYVKTGYRLVKLYLPSILLIGGSIGCIIGSHNIMVKRNIGLSAAYAGLSESFNKYRENIVSKFGEAADVEARHNLKVKKKKGKDGEEDTYEYSATDKTVEDDYSRFFDAESSYWDKNVNMNLIFLHQTEYNLNRKLKLRRSHTIPINEVYDALDVRPEKSEKGQVIGYRYRKGFDPVDENGNPQVIKFMIYVLTNTGERVKKSLDEVINDNDVKEPVMLIDFAGLEVIV